MGRYRIEPALHWPVSRMVHLAISRMEDKREFTPGQKVWLVYPGRDSIPPQPCAYKAVVKRYTENGRYLIWCDDGEDREVPQSNMLTIEDMERLTLIESAEMVKFKERRAARDAEQKSRKEAVLSVWGETEEVS